jgi:hypothetical protein
MIQQVKTIILAAAAAVVVVVVAAAASVAVAVFLVVVRCRLRLFRGRYNISFPTELLYSERCKLLTADLQQL